MLPYHASLQFGRTREFRLPHLIFISLVTLILLISTTNAYSAQATIVWNPNSESDLSGYKMYYGSSSRNYDSGVDVGNQTSYTISGLVESETYYIALTAYDFSGNESNYSAELVYNVPDATLPTTPTSLQATAISKSQIDLSWNASTDNTGITGYRIYRDGTQIASTVSTTYKDTGLSPSTTYSYAVSAYDAAGNESDQSTSDSATTQGLTTIFSTLDSYLGNASNWEPLTPGRWEVVSDGGGLRYGINTTSYSNLSGSSLGEYSLIKDNTYDDFTFTAKVKSTEDLSSNTASDYNIIFGYQDPNNYYFMMFNSTPAYSQLFKIVNGSRQLIADATNLAVTDNAYHDVRFEKTGNNIRVYFDGTEKINTTDTTFFSGRVGIGGFNDASLWDDIIVTTIDTIAPNSPQGFTLTVQ